MPTRVLLEGPQIEPLLDQVRRDYGPAARIISAEKVRTGGLAGFFARQKFELSIEIGDEPADETPAGATQAAADRSAPRSLEELLALTEATGTDLTAPAVRKAAPAAAAPVAPAAAPAPPAAPVATAPAPAAPLVTPVNAAMVPRAGLVSTNGAAFAEVMASLNTPLSVAEAPAVAEAPVVAATAAQPPAGPLTSSIRPYRPPVVSTAGPLSAALGELGVPEKLAARASSADPYQAVLQALATVPDAPRPPKRAGDVLVVVGELAHALPIARQVSEQLRLDPAKLLLAAASVGGTGLHHSRRITGAADARRRARTLHRDDTAHVVVVDAPVDGPDDGWVEEICNELGATAVWAAVDATRKTADTAAHLRRLGKVDAVALYGAAATGDPAGPLALGLPVALLDGRPAGPHAWAALLTERLGETNPNGE